MLVDCRLAEIEAAIGAIREAIGIRRSSGNVGAEQPYLEVLEILVFLADMLIAGNQIDQPERTCGIGEFFHAIGEGEGAGEVLEVAIDSVTGFVEDGLDFSGDRLEIGWHIQSIADGVRVVKW